MKIDPPNCKNVVLYISVDSRLTPTATAYQGKTQVFQTALIQPAGFQNFPLLTPSSITQVIISLTGTPPIKGCLLARLSYEVETPLTLDGYPHITDFEPKTRDLYQAATDQGEILTASNSGVSTGKSFSSTSSSEMGLGLNASVGANVGGVNVSVGGDLTSKWGNTTTDGSTTQIDQSRERRETQGSTTNITQQYNILTGYHAGTNRASFLMLLFEQFYSLDVPAIPVYRGRQQFADSREALMQVEEGLTIEIA